ncbi:unnamed protein product [Acanthosepion pharaonis]|uniref:Uncharacterized protein n=1 Tax=Acanthosepion pharaonis TaxID=158019 RepID=A0A812D2Q3_ACAPH|nr:unnamed protein product [Sepia pharaonis]
MALLFQFCYHCVICCLCCGLVFAKDSNSLKTRHNSAHQKHEKQSQKRDNQQPLDIKPKSRPSAHATSSRSLESATETKQTESSGVLLVDSIYQSVTEIAGVNNAETKHYFGPSRVGEKHVGRDNNAANEDDVYILSKRQSATERADKSPSIASEIVDARNVLKNGEDHQGKIHKGSNIGKNLNNNLNSDGSEISFPTKEDYLHRYYGMNRKERQNIKQRKRARDEEKEREKIISSAASSKPMTGPASLSKAKSVHESNGQSPSDEDSINATGDRMTENNRKNLYIYDKHHIGDEINYIEDDEDDNMNYAEHVSKYTGGRVKRRVARVRDEWPYGDDRNVGYAGYREKNKERYSGGRSRNRRGKGRGSNPYGHERSDLEVGPSFDQVSSDDPDPAEYPMARSPRRSHQKTIGIGKGGGGGGGGGRRGGSGGGGGGGRGAGRDRRYGNRHDEFDSSERSYLEEEYSEVRPHSASSPPSLSPSRHSDTYARYSEDPSGTKNPKSPTQKTCHICTMKKMDREMRLRSLKAQIIKQIGLSELPNITKNDRILSKVPTLKHIIENMTMQRDEPSWRDFSDDKMDDINEQMIITAESRK